MDRKRLAMELSKIPDHPRPDTTREQVRTPGDIAAWLLMEGADCGDLEDRTVLDLGSGTGVLGIGAALLGARHVLAVDIDPDACAIATAEAARCGVTAAVTVQEADITRLTPGDIETLAGGPVDTVVMNPPFGADLTSRARGGDRVFLGLAYQSADVVLSLHPVKTEKFLAAFARDAGFVAARIGKVAFPLKARFAHHKDPVQVLDVGLYRTVRKSSER